MNRAGGSSGTSSTFKKREWKEDSAIFVPHAVASAHHFYASERSAIAMI